jgi:hypothetical protein
MHSIWRDQARADPWVLASTLLFLGPRSDVVIFAHGTRIKVRLGIDLPSSTAYTYWRGFQ